MGLFRGLGILIVNLYCRNGSVLCLCPREALQAQFLDRVGCTGRALKKC
jgi:hypothetical protein